MTRSFNDIFPLIFATTKTITYFLTGFTDSKSRFKMFDGDDSPTTETPFISVEIIPGGMDQRTGWMVQTVMFHCTGKDTDIEILWNMANALAAYYKANEKFSDGTQYILVDQIDFAPPTNNPVTEHRIVTVALHFGMAE